MQGAPLYLQTVQVENIDVAKLDINVNGIKHITAIFGLSTHTMFYNKV